MTRSAAQDQDRWNEYWTRYAFEYDEHQLSRLAHADERATWSRIWADALPIGTRSVLDVGTGTGNVALQLAADGYEVTGIDLSEGMLERARAKCAGHPAPPTFLRGDAVQPPFPPGSFDAIVSRYVLWTLRDAASALQRWHELLRPGGTLVAVDGP
ncbi:methylase involved in ubiquinone/menaquinone biosynthesis [Brachybacterium faecium DSM 4810]|uniref:Methylase involved in ubiquinone/menaquinone biosynthesis n=1 Tax=Brachybacterium faecium (strain ATCC 43885 / DSM 4810 / JCM 11609 / LMG 19847 / NBRC 14762 / NCIMB 9860 / 6-10) TaxID=446465 RepID=C7MH99_BRAFD|nr:class I SAM-dependent methyltransferase [Brachybacterium faecium]ACU84308.1 methylase involved in ubiquinone/menaquinone biosynthesis [Brachybacterium faecium DSM 4810]